MNCLKIADKNSVDSYLNPNHRMLALKEKTEAPEIFQTVVILKSAKMYIHFRVSRIIQLLQKYGVNESRAISINIDEFKKKERINWTETETKRTKNEPIIIVPFTIGESYKEIVIDGNHRITRAIQDKKTTIKAYLISPQILVDNHLLCSQFDELLYVFQNEIVWMSSILGQEEGQDALMLSKSYLRTQQVHVQL